MSILLPDPLGGFPAPTGTFPAPPTDPTFGVNPYRPGNMYTPKLFDPTASALTTSQRAMQEQALQQAAQAAMVNQALGTDVPPTTNEWTPQEAALQTDRALAKLSTVNPEAAQQLAEQRVPGQESGNGLLDGLKDVVGTLLHPALSIAGQVLDVVGRTANIVPNLVFDAVDGGDWDAAQDIGGALTGNMRHNWNGVAQELGWTGGGVGGYLRAGLGLAADVATDPLTWIIPTGAAKGLAGGAGAELLAGKVVQEERGLLSRAAGVYGSEGIDIARTKMWERVQGIAKGIDYQAARRAGVESATLRERALAFANGIYETNESELLADAFELYDKSYRLFRTRTIGKLIRSGGEITLSSGRAVESGTIRDMLEAGIKAGKFQVPDSAAWREAQTMSSVLGGTRFKVAVPFSKLRYISPALRVGAFDTTGMGMEAAARFFAGQSGMTRLVGAIADGTEGATWADLTNWMEGGWSHARTQNPALVEALRGRGLNFGSQYRALSDRVGGITVKLSKEAEASRRGLGGFLAYRSAVQARDAMADFTRQVATSVEIGEGKQARDTWVQTSEAIGYNMKEKKVTVTPEQMRRHIRLLDGVPVETVDLSSARAIDDWFWAQPENAALRATGTLPKSPEDLARLDRAERIVAGIKADAAELSPAEREWLRYYQRVESHGRDLAAAHEVAVGDVRMKLEEAVGINPGQREEYWYGTQDVETKKVYYIHEERPPQRGNLDATGIDKTHKTHGTDGHGIVVYSERQHPNDIPVVIRGKDFVRLDENGDALLSGAEATVHTQREAVEAAVDAHGQVGGMVGPEWDEFRRQKVAEGLTAEVRARRPDASGIIRNENGVERVTIFDPNNVRLSRETDQVVGLQRGYYHRVLNKEFMEWLRGTPDAGRALLLKEPNIHAYASRSTSHLTIEEADAHFRALLAKHLPDADMSTLPDFLWETNPMIAHGKYITDLGDALGAEMLGQSARRFVVMKQLAPAMFGRGGPRGPEWAWQLAPGLEKTLRKMDKATQTAVMRAVKTQAQVQQVVDNKLSAVADEFGILMGTADALFEVGDTDLPSRLVQAMHRYETNAAAGQELVDKSLAVVDKRRAAIAAEQAEYDEAKQQFVDDLVINLRSGDPKVIGNTEAFITDSTGRTWRVPADFVGDSDFTWDDLVEGASMSQNASPGYFKRQRGGAGDHIVVFHGAPLAVEGPLDARGAGAFAQGGGAFYVTPDSPTAAYYSYAGIAGGQAIEGNIGRYGARGSLSPNMVASVVKFRKDGVFFAEDAVTDDTLDRITKALKGSPIEEQWDEYVDEVKNELEPDFPRHSYTGSTIHAKLSDLWDEAAIEGGTDVGFGGGQTLTNQTLGKAGFDGIHFHVPSFDTPPGVADDVLTTHIQSGQFGDTYTDAFVVFDPDKTLVNMGNIDRMPREVSGKEAADLFDQAATDGKLVHNRQTNSVFRADGSPVKKGGGRTLRSNGDRAVERDFLQDQADQLAKDRAAFAEGAAPLAEREADLRTARARGKNVPATSFRGIDRPYTEGREAEEKIAAIAADMQENGWSGPPVQVRVSDYRSTKWGGTEVAPGVWVAVTDGGHRLAAAEQVGLTDIPVQVETFKVADADVPEFLRGAPAPEKRGGAEVKAAATARAEQTAAESRRTAASHAVSTGRRLGALQEQMSFAMAEVNKARAEAKGVRASMKPALVKVTTQAGDMAGMTPLRVPGMEGFAMPAYIADEWHWLLDRHGPGHLRSEWRQFVTGPWKRWATYRWPGFHIRNFFGAWFNNYLGGVGVREYDFSWRVNRARAFSPKWRDAQVSLREFDNYNLAAVFGPEARGSLTYGNVSKFIGEHGIGRANASVVMGTRDNLDTFSTTMEDLAKGRGNKAQKVWGTFDSKMRTLGSSVEDYHRTAAWATGMAATGGDPYGARAFVMMRHGDYADLTDTEDAIRDVVPFYKWMRTNVPFQIRNLAENPAATTLIADKAKTAVYDSQGIDRQQAELQQPAWMKGSLAVPIPSWVPLIGSKGKDAMKFAMLDLPYGDLYNGLQDYLSSTLPVVRNVLESYGLEKTVFSGRPLEGRMQPLSGAFNIPGVRDLLSAVGVASKGPDGNLYIEDKLQNVLMAFPIYSRFRNFVEGDPDRAASRVGSMFSMIAGLGIREGDATDAELDFYYNEVEPLLQQYRDMGVQFPTADDFQSESVGSALGTYASTNQIGDENGLVTQGAVA